MTSFAEILKNSFIVLKKEPKLFVPKIFLALLWGGLLLYSVDLLKRIQEINSVVVLEEKAFLLNEILPASVALLFFSFLFFVFDSVINSAYPLMVQKYLSKQPFSVFASVKSVLFDFNKIVLPVLIAFFAGILVLFPFTLMFSFFFTEQNTFLLGVTALIILAVTFIVSVMFYFIYPVASIERKGLASVINTIKKSRKNFFEASFGTFIAMILSVVSALLVSFSDATELTVLALIVFVVLRIITAVLATYSMVLNPLLYFKK
ncbi:MAG: hypothetical protein ABIJ74_00295 [archaeon]